MSNDITFIFETNADLSIIYDSSAVTTFEVLSLGTGDIASAATAAASGNIAQFSGITGHVIGDSGYAVTDFSLTTHSHSASYSALGHGHVAGDITAATPAGRFLQDNGTWGVPAGAGDVTGPVTSATLNFASWSDSTGNVLADSGYAGTSFSLAAHGHSGTYASYTHSHSASYLGLSAKAADSDLLDSHDTTYFATAVHTHSTATYSAATHSHSASYLALAGKAADAELLDGQDSTYYATAVHTHSTATYAAAVHSHSASYLGLHATADSASNADTLDGSHATAFAIAGHTHSTATYAAAVHSHSASYLGLSAKAADAELLDNHDSTYFATAAHAHSTTATYAPLGAITSLEISGFVSFGGSGDFYSMTSGGRFTVLRSGAGKLSGQPITWAGGEFVDLTANKGYIIGYSATNTLAAIDFSTVYNSDIYTYFTNFADALKNYVVLFTVWYDGSEWMVSRNNHPYSYISDIASHDHFRLGSVFIGSGAYITMLSAANRTIDLQGSDMIDDHGVESNIPDSTGAALSTIGLWKNGSNLAQRYHRRNFTVSGVSTAPTAGATYTTGAGDVFTVLFTNTGKTTIETWGSTWVGEPTASGTLTKISGTGDNSISYSACSTNRVIPCSYVSGGVPVPLGTSGATRYGIFAIYALPNDMQTPNTTSPTPVYIAILSSTTYNGAAGAALSLGTGAGPTMTQFVMPTEIAALEPVLLGFVICDGNDRQIDAYTGSGFTNGVRSYKMTPTASFSAGAISVTSAANVLTVTSSFAGVLTTADTDVQKALDTLDDHTHAAGDADTLDSHDSTYFATSVHTHSTATYAAAVHSHSASYLAIAGKAADSELLDGQDSTYFATAVHTHSTATYAAAVHSHSASYLGLSAKAADSDLLDSHDTTYFATAVHTHSSATYEPTLTKGNLTGTSPISIDQTRQVIGGAAVISVAAATTSASGVVELATNAEAMAGTDTARAVTPAALKYALEPILPAADGSGITSDAWADFAPMLSQSQKAGQAFTSGIVSTYSLVYTGTNNYQGGVLAPNGDIHFVSCLASVGQKISAAGVVSTYSLVYTAGGYDYMGGVLAANGDIHFISFRAPIGQKISAAGVVSTYSLVYTGTNFYQGGVLAPNGDIHFVPGSAAVGQKISAAGVVSTYALAYSVANAYCGGVLAPNGDIHFVPRAAAVGQKISAAGVVSTYALAYSVADAYFGGVLAPNGDIHFVPRAAAVGQKISAAGVVSTYALVYTVSEGYNGGVLAPNGDIHFIPRSAAVGQKISAAGVVSTYALVYTVSGAYVGGVLTPDGEIHFIPFAAAVGQRIHTLAAKPFNLGMCCHSFFNKL